MKFAVFLLLTLFSAQLPAATGFDDTDPLLDSVRKNENAAAYATALVFADKWVEKMRSIADSDSLAYATALDLKGNLVRKWKNPRESLPMLEKAYRLRKAVLPPEHPDLGASLHNLGAYHYTVNEYAKAEDYLLGAIAIRKKALGPDHPDLASSLDLLSFLYIRLNDYPKIESICLQALEIRRKAFGNEHPEVATSLTTLGVFYNHTNRIPECESTLKKAIEIRKKTQGPMHPDVSFSMNYLANLYNNFGQFSKAEPVYLEAISIKEKAHGSDHPELGRLCFNLGLLYHDKGDFAKAEPLWLRALEIRKKSLGPDQFDVSLSNLSLAGLYRGTARTTEAQKYYLEAALQERSIVRRFFTSFSQQEREAFLRMGLDNRQEIQSFMAEEGMLLKELRGELYDQMLFFKGLLINTSARWKNRIKTSGDMKLIGRYEQWEALQQRIARLYFSTDSKERQELDTLVPAAERLEKELARRSEFYAIDEDRRPRSWKEVQKALRPGEAAVEMVRFRKFGIHRYVTDTCLPGRPVYPVNGLSPKAQYAALILTDASPVPEMVILPQGDEMENGWIRDYRNFISVHTKEKKLYNQFWKPIGQKLRGIKKVWFSADGVYHQINLNTLRNPETGKYVADEIEIALLGSTKDLLRKGREEDANLNAILLGNPDFKPLNLVASGGKSRSGPALSYIFRPDPDLEIPSLPGTQAEIDSVSILLQQHGWEVQVISRQDATENKIKDCFKPRVMLLSTHGFFRESEQPEESTLLRSGLLLSGAAQTLREGYRGEGEDGILTAYEAMNLNLDNTELVVLSGCETGLSETRKTGETVFGLQRSFQVAGARNVIMSLWKVDDQVTRKLVVRFFRNWLSGMEKRKAFRLAQAEIRKENPLPYYWGGFVMLGK